MKDGFMKKVMLGSDDMKRIGGVWIKTYHQVYEFGFLTIMNAVFLQYQIALYGQPTLKLIFLNFLQFYYIYFGFCYCEESILATWAWKQHNEGFLHMLIF